MLDYSGQLSNGLTTTLSERVTMPNLLFLVSILLRGGYLHCAQTDEHDGNYNRALGKAGSRSPPRRSTADGSAFGLLPNVAGSRPTGAM